jgi:hypothetical protein
VIFVKGSVRPHSLWIMAAAANVVEKHGAELGIDTIVVTSGNDSAHMPGSFHGKDRALDFRTRTLPTRAAKERFRALLLERLGVEFQAVLEDLDGPNEHLHVEHDPA